MNKERIKELQSELVTYEKMLAFAIEKDETSAAKTARQEIAAIKSEIIDLERNEGLEKKPTMVTASLPAQIVNAFTTEEKMAYENVLAVQDPKLDKKFHAKITKKAKAAPKAKAEVAPKASTKPPKGTGKRGRPAGKNAVVETNLDYKKPLSEDLLEQANHVEIGSTLFAVKPTESGTLDIPVKYTKDDMILAVQGKNDEIYPVAVLLQNKEIYKNLQVPNLQNETSKAEPTAKQIEKEKEDILEHLQEVVKEGKDNIDNKTEQKIERVKEILSHDDISKENIQEAVKMTATIQESIAEEEEPEKHKQRQKPHEINCNIDVITRKDNPLQVAIKRAILKYQDGDGGRLIRVLFDKDKKEVVFEYKGGFWGTSTDYYKVCLKGKNKAEHLKKKPENTKTVVGEDTIRKMAVGNNAGYKECQASISAHFKECKNGDCSDEKKADYEKNISNCKYYAKKYSLYRSYSNYIHNEAKQLYAKKGHSSYYNAYNEVVDNLRKKHLKDTGRSTGNFGARRKEVNV